MRELEAQKCLNLARGNLKKAKKYTGLTKDAFTGMAHDYANKALQIAKDVPRLKSLRNDARQVRASAAGMYRANNFLPMLFREKAGEETVPSTAEISDQGRKDDNGKPRFDLVPPDALLAVAKVLQYGADKYGPENWKRVDNREQRYIAAALRHINAHQRKNVYDPESELPHLAHAITSLLFVLQEMLENENKEEELPF